MLSSFDPKLLQLPGTGVSRRLGSRRGSGEIYGSVFSVEVEGGERVVGSFASSLLTSRQTAGPGGRPSREVAAEAVGGSCWVGPHRDVPSPVHPPGVRVHLH